MATDRQVIELVSRRFEPAIRQSFLNMVAGVKDRLVLRYVRELVESGRTVEAASVMQTHLQAVANLAVQAHVQAAGATAGVIAQGLRTTVAFDQVNVQAVQVMQQEQLRLITQVTQEQVANIRQTLLEGITTGLNPRQQARELVANVGLTQRQVAAVNNYRRLLENQSIEALQRELRDARFDPSVINGNLDRAKIERMVEAYRRNMLRFRAETIARTESLRAAHAGSANMFRQAISDGRLDPDQITQEWVAAGDDRTREHHAEMHGQKVKWGEPFVSGLGNRLMYPGDPSAPPEETINCRCARTIRIT